jgi:beta-lactam-binding protein with PASTA domain
MSLKKFLTTKLFLKNLGLAFLVIFVLIAITMFLIARYTNRGEIIATPNFSGLNINEVNEIADQKNFLIEVHDSVYRKNIKVGTILVQNPIAGHKIKPGRIIYLTIASALPEKVEVPKLTDISLRQARVLLESKGFALGVVEYRPSEFDGLVLDQKYKGQSITQGTRIDNGSTIDLVAGGKGIGGETTVPSLIGLTLANAKEQIISRLLSPGAVIFDTSIHTAIDTMNASVWKQIPPGDSTKHVSTGLSVDLWLRHEIKDTIKGTEIKEPGK